MTESEKLRERFVRTLRATLKKYPPSRFQTAFLEFCRGWHPSHDVRRSVARTLDDLLALLDDLPDTQGAPKGHTPRKRRRSRRPRRRLSLGPAIWRTARTDIPVEIQDFQDDRCVVRTSSGKQELVHPKALIQEKTK